MARGLSITVAGMADVIAALSGLKESVTRTLTSAAARAALRPLVKTARAGVPVNTGNLRKSIGVKRVKKNRKRGEMTLLVGARAGYRWAYGYSSAENDPVRYAGPVEWGHRNKGGFVPPAGFLRNAYNQHRATVVVDFGVQLRTRIENYLARKKRK